MKVLFDECMPRRLGSMLVDHEVTTATRAGWSGIKNGKLLKLAESEFDAMLTVDKSLYSQQNIKQYDIALVVLRAKSNSIEDLAPLVEQVNAVLKSVQSGDYIEISE